jgi:transglutaminase-like putative cysteine protease
MYTRFLLALMLVYTGTATIAQDHGFDYGQATYRELDMKQYDKDTTAEAVILQEFGEAYIDNSNDHNLLLEYHVRIKILKKSGVRYANIEIPRYHQESRSETVRKIRASSYNYENGSMKETRFDGKNIFVENVGRYWDVSKFAIPNVRQGSVIEFSYILESPFIFNFRDWEFQSDIPKIYSEYWATIPGNYIFNITLRGFLKLDLENSEVVKDCFAPGGGYRADCARYKWAMKDIPAFREEEYMTAKSNFLSTINFELSEIQHFDGRKDKFTKEWKDVEDELRHHDDFGSQLKNGRHVFDDGAAVTILAVSDPLARARQVYDYIKSRYTWNESYGYHSESGIRKAFEKRKGNIGDINLSLIAALRYAKIDVEPLILSTRSHGLPTDIHPVMSDFNYVVAKVEINGKTYLLDATIPYLPFGMLPERCLNGRGRVMRERESYWYDLKPADKSKEVQVVDMRLSPEGKLTGSLQTTYTGYAALYKRLEVGEFTNEQEYLKDFAGKYPDVEVVKYTVEGADEFDKPLIEKMELSVQVFDQPGARGFLFSPFVARKRRENPFKSIERLYPVDFGVPIERTLVFSMAYPENYELIEPPKKVGLALPNDGGRFLFDIQQTGNRLSLHNSLQLKRAVYSSEEYHYLKELYNQVVAIEQTDLVFRKKG